jgi:hypothetical protein
MEQEHHPPLLMQRIQRHRSVHPKTAQTLSVAKVMQGAARQWRVSTVVMSSMWRLALGMTSSNRRGSRRGRGSREGMRRRGACRLTSMSLRLYPLSHRLWKEKRSWGRRACS